MVTELELDWVYILSGQVIFEQRDNYRHFLDSSDHDGRSRLQTWIYPDKQIIETYGLAEVGGELKLVSSKTIMKNRRIQ